MYELKSRIVSVVVHQERLEDIVGFSWTSLETAAGAHRSSVFPTVSQTMKTHHHFGRET
jgi:hypothetical protein